jgi:hypothetical protein
VTEAEWLNCTNPTPMLGFLRGKAGERKLRLFAIGCSRAIRSLLTKQPTSLLDHERRILAIGEQKLAIAEQYADGSIRRSAIDTAYCDILGLLSMRRPEQEPWAFALVADLRATSTGCCRYGQVWERDRYDAWQCAVDAGNYLAWVAEAATDLEAVHRMGVVLCRCVFGNPFRSIALDASWKTPTVNSLAEGVYDDRAFDRLPILADALEEAGCTDATILEHLRSAGPHVRGCFAVDLLLGRE